MSCLSEPLPLLAVNFTQASAITSFSKSSLRKMVKDGRLRATKLGRRVVIPVDGLKELVGFGVAQEKPAVAQSAGAQV